MLGPIVAEFCLRLWQLGAQFRQRDELVMMFCARGGLRMLQAYRTFLLATGLPEPAPAVPLMVSRLVASRVALRRCLEHGDGRLPPATAATLTYEFSGRSVAAVASALSGLPMAEVAPHDATFTPEGLSRLLEAPEGAPIRAEIIRQADLFDQHLHGARQGRSHLLLVDTGLYGSTERLLAEGLEGVDLSCALLARSFRPLPGHGRTHGLCLEAEGYSPLVHRSALLRYWHFVEWLFEPSLPSVRSFADVEGDARSNLEVDGWQGRVPPEPGTAFYGVMAYLEDLRGPEPTARVLRESVGAWQDLRRAVVWPTAWHGVALAVGTRSHDFGLAGTWDERPWPGAFGVLRGSSMWREGEIARSHTRLRIPLLLALEGAYCARWLRRGLRRLRWNA